MHSEYIIAKYIVFAETVELWQSFLNSMSFMILKYVLATTTGNMNVTIKYAKNFIKAMVLL